MKLAAQTILFVLLLMAFGAAALLPFGLVAVQLLARRDDPAPADAQATSGINIAHWQPDRHQPAR